jgi:hypothetical protein
MAIWNEHTNIITEFFNEILIIWSCDDGYKGEQLD